jgi:hypothetical protein
MFLGDLRRSAGPFDLLDLALSAILGNVNGVLLSGGLVILRSLIAHRLSTRDQKGRQATAQRRAPVRLLADGLTNRIGGLPCAA